MHRISPNYWLFIGPQNLSYFKPIKLLLDRRRPIRAGNSASITGIKNRHSLLFFFLKNNDTFPLMKKLIDLYQLLLVGL